MEEIDAELTRGLTAAERQTLIDLMVRLTDNARTLLSAWDQSVADVPAEIEPGPQWTISVPRLRPADGSDRPALPDSHLTSWGGCSAR